MRLLSKIIIYLRVALVPLQVLSIDQAFDPLLQISRFYWEFQLQITHNKNSNPITLHSKLHLHQYWELSSLSQQWSKITRVCLKKDMKKVTCWKSSVIKRVWLKTFLVFIIRTMAASICKNRMRWGESVMSNLLSFYQTVS